MAVEAEFHFESLGPVRQWHPVDPSVTLDAGDPFGNVNVMAEIHIVGNAGDTMPVEWPVLGEALPDGRKDLGVRPDLRMAGHANVRRWKTCVSAGFDGRVTIAAVDSEIAGVMLVAEGHRLKRSARNHIPILRTRKRERDKENADRKPQRTKRDRSKPCVGRAGEDLRHGG